MNNAEPVEAASYRIPRLRGSTRTWVRDEAAALFRDHESYDRTRAAQARDAPQEIASSQETSG
jgi:hypothetical protein